MSRGVTNTVNVGVRSIDYWLNFPGYVTSRFRYSRFRY